MRVSALRKHVALAVVIGLTLCAAVAGATVTLQREARRERAAQALADYRAQVRQIFTDLYDDVQPMEVAVDLLWRQPAHDVFPARDLIASREVPDGIQDAVSRLARLRVPPALASPARELTGKLHELGAAVDGFPPLNHEREYLAAEFGAAAAAVETALYEVSVPLKEVLGDALPPLPGVPDSTKRAPESHGSYLVASAHICGPADRQLRTLPDVGDVTDPHALPTIRRTATVMTHVLSQLTALPRPPKDSRELKRDIVTPLQQDPNLGAALTDLADALAEHDHAALADVSDEFDAADEAASGAAHALEAYGASSCADLLNSFLGAGDESLNA